MKRIICLLAACVAFAAAAPGWSASKDQLHLYNWNNYIAPQTIKRFEGETARQFLRELERRVEHRLTLLVEHPDLLPRW